MKLKSKLIDDGVLKPGFPPGVYNCDLVLKAFRLNGVVFAAGVIFPVATQVLRTIENSCENDLPAGPVGKEFGGSDCEYD
jgi:hypothetical protein